MNNSTRGEIAIGAAWMLAFKLTERSLGFLSTLVLVRVLTPADFGVMAMAMSLIAALELLKSFSFDVALIQRHEVNRGHLDTAWTFNLIFGVLVALLIVVLARPAAGYYSEPQLEAVAYALAIGWLAQSFENIGVVAFRRDLKFSDEYRFLVAKRVATVAVTVPLAFWLRNFWALVVGIVVGKLLSVLISYALHPHRPRLSLVAARDLMSFSGWLFVNNVLYFFNERVADFVLGRIAGTRALGIYNVASEIASMPTTEIVAPINRVMLPGYSKIAREGSDLGRTYMDTVGVMALFSLPAGLGIAALAKPIVDLLLGPQWQDAVPLIQILGIYGAIASLGTSTASALMAVGRQRALTALAALRLVLLVPAVIWGCQASGTVGAAWAVLGVTAVVTPINFGALLPVLGLRVPVFIAAIWRPIAASMLMYIAMTAALDALHASRLDHVLLQLFVGMVVGGATLLVAIVALWRLSGRPESAESIVVRQLAALLAARRSREA